MAVSDWAYYDHDRGEYGYYTEDGAWHPIDKQMESVGF